MATLTATVGPFEGLGLFSGCRSSLRFLPGKPGAGLRVQRLSFDQVATQRALVQHVSKDATWAGPAAPLVRNTTLLVSAQPDNVVAPDASKVAATIEHAMAALAGLHVWDATIEINAAEVPILDGSAKDFVASILPALAPGSSPAPIVLRERVEVRDRDATIIAEPVASMHEASYTYNLDYAGRGGIAAQSYTWRNDPDAFARDIAP
ncbi:MAG TPA: UDP-3-O-acyl-N-acetylglucosamine deacetylase, partial [Phycisphaerales bacterium]|nr:UDP-3-O-acyl-N-acetylglucosamine deacetylase [Phycisphaerales bacterium]